MTLKLSERTMLVTLRIGSYSGMITDQGVTDAAHDMYQAESNAGRYGKLLIARKFSSKVGLAHRHARDTHKLMTLPWEDDGTRIITTKAYILYTTKMKQCKSDVEAEVRIFVKGLPSYIEEAKHRLKGMFNEADYPTEEELESKFSFDVEVSSVPDASDFRAKLNDDQTKHIVKDIEQRCYKKVDAAMADVYTRVAKMVSNLSEKLKEIQPGKKSASVIRDSVLYNIYEFAENMMPILNVTDDNKMEEIRQQMLALTAAHSPAILREDAKARQESIAQADKISKKLQQYMK